MAIAVPEFSAVRVVWFELSSLSGVDEAISNIPSGAPVIVSAKMAISASLGETVEVILDDMEKIAVRYFPVWLPGAEGITTSAGAAAAAVRALAIRHAMGSSQYGPFLADLAAGALAGRERQTRRHLPEVRARGLGRVLAASLGREHFVLALRPLGELDGGTASVLDGAAQWLVDHGRLPVWIFATVSPAAPRPEMTKLSTADSASEAGPGGDDVHLSTASKFPPGFRPVGERSGGEAGEWPRGNANARRVERPRVVSGKPHPSSAVEVLLESALAERPWAAGRSWNCTVRLGTLVNPVRVDLLWVKEKCIVEIDGADHRGVEKFSADRQRDVMLQIHGYVVLRFTNNQVLDDVENVLALLQQFLAGRRRTRKGR